MTSQKLNHCQAHWSLELSEFNFLLLHKPGSSMICADALSRHPDYDKGLGNNDSITILKPEFIRRSAVDYPPSPIIRSICIHAPENLSTFNKNSPSPGWSHQDGLTTWYNCIVVPDTPDLREPSLRKTTTQSQQAILVALKLSNSFSVTSGGPPFQRLPQIRRRLPDLSTY